MFGEPTFLAMFCAHRNPLMTIVATTGYPIRYWCARPVHRGGSVARRGKESTWGLQCQSEPQRESS